MSRAQLKIHDLPNKILSTVFDCMDFETLLSSTQVCKKWNQMIGKKLKLVINNENEKKLSETLTRKYSAIMLRNLNSVHHKLEDILNIADLRILEVLRCRMNEEGARKLNKILASTKKLERLKIINSDFDLDLTYLSGLQSLYLERHFFKIINFGETTQLKSLTLNKVAQADIPLIDFIASQKNLKQLVLLDCFGLNNNNSEKLNAIQFPLKKLALNNYDKIFDSEKNLLLFMSKFTKFLEELEFDTKFPASFYEMIFTKFHKLNTFKFIVSSPGLAIDFYKICPNLSVRKLIVDGYRNYLKPIKGLIEKLPNIETLVLYELNLTNELMMSISLNLTKLKNLVIDKIPDKAFEHVKILSLRTISIKSLERNKPRYWTTITLALPNIEVFKVLSPGKTMNDININIITKGWLQLKHITLGKGFLAQKIVCNQLLSNCRNLKTLEISENALKASEKVEIVNNIERNGVSLNIRP